MEKSYSVQKLVSPIIDDIGSLDSLIWKSRPALGDVFLKTVLIYYLFGVYYSLCVLDLDEITADPTIEDLAHGLFKCISVWNYAVQIYFYISINMTYHVLRNYPPEHRLVPMAESYTSFIEKSFLSVVFPLSMFVCNTFWYVYHTNRDLIFPPVVEDSIPPWYNHTLHTLPAFIVFLHILLVKHRSSPLALSTSVIIQSSFHTFYLSMLLLIRYVEGVWLYKFLGYYAVSRTSQITSALLFCFLSPNVYVWIGYKTEEEIQLTVAKINKKNKLEALAKANNNNNDSEWKLK